MSEPTTRWLIDLDVRGQREPQMVAATLDEALRITTDIDTVIVESRSGVVTEWQRGAGRSRAWLTPVEGA